MASVICDILEDVVDDMCYTFSTKLSVIQSSNPNTLQNCRLTSYSHDTQNLQLAVDC